MIVKAIKSLLPNAKFIISGNSTYDDIEWQDSRDKPSKADVDAEIIKVTAEYDAQAYARSRQAEYPSLLELTVALYDTDDKSAVEAKRAAVKLKYPKPS